MWAGFGLMAFGSGLSMGFIFDFVGLEGIGKRISDVSIG